MSTPGFDPAAPAAQVPAADEVISARWVLTMDPVGDCLDDGAVVLANGAIARVCAIDELTIAEQALPRSHLADHVLMPGLINAHGHAAMALFRGMADDLSLESWLEEHIWPAEAAHSSERFVADGTALAAADMLLSGTTCFSDMYYFPEVAAPVARRFGMRTQLAFPVIQFPNAWSASADEGISKGLALHDQYRGDDCVHIAFGPHSTYTNEPRTLERVATLAAEIGLPVQIHLHETATEVASERLRHGCTPVALLERIGLLGPGLQAVHVTQCADADLELLAEHGVSVIHCPQSNLRLASGLCPVAALRAEGVRVALGTDSAASNNGLDLFQEMRVATLLARAVSGEATTQHAAEALAMGTIEGAKALGLDHLIGSITPGKRADLIGIHLRQPSTWPVYDPITTLVTTGAAAGVREVWVDGRRILQDRNFVSVSVDDVLERAGAWQASIAARQ